MPNSTGSDGSRSGSALARLRVGEPVFGVLQLIPDPTLTELAVWSGYDFIILDGEHGVRDERAYLGCLQAISGTDSFAIIRVAPGQLDAIGRYLDFGADGIMMPDVRTAAEAASFVRAATFGPLGTRSSTSIGTRSTRYGLAGPARPAESPLLLAQIEGMEAVENVTAIAATVGLGGLIVGSHDLSADQGTPGDHATEAYQDAFLKIEHAATEAGLLLGGGAHPGYPIERLIAGGHRVIVASVDIVALREGFLSHLKAARASRVGLR